MKFNMLISILILFSSLITAYSKVVIKANDLDSFCDKNLYKIIINVEISDKLEDYVSFYLKTSSSKKDILFKCMIDPIKKQIICIANLQSHKIALNAQDSITLPYPFPEVEGIYWDYITFLYNIFRRTIRINGECGESVLRSNITKLNINRWDLITKVNKIYGGQCLLSDSKDNFYSFNMNLNIIAGNLKNKLDNAKIEKKELKIVFMQNITMPFVIGPLQSLVKNNFIYKSHEYYKMAYCYPIEEINTDNYEEEEGINFHCDIPISDQYIFNGPLKVSHFSDNIYAKLSSKGGNDTVDIVSIYFTMEKNPILNSNSESSEDEENDKDQEDEDDEEDFEEDENNDENENENDEEISESEEQKNEDTQKNEVQNLNNKNTDIKNVNPSASPSKSPKNSVESKSSNNPVSSSSNKPLVSSQKIPSSSKSFPSTSNTVPSKNPSSSSSKSSSFQSSSKTSNLGSSQNTNFLSSSSKASSSPSPSPSKTPVSSNLRRMETSSTKNKKSYLLLDNKSNNFICPDKPIFEITDIVKGITYMPIADIKDKYNIILTGHLKNGYKVSDKKIIPLEYTIDEIKFNLSITNNLVEEISEKKKYIPCSLSSGTFFLDNEITKITCLGEKKEQKLLENTDITINWASKQNKYLNDIVIKWPKDLSVHSKTIYSYKINALSIKKTDHICFDDKYYFYINILDLKSEPEISFEIKMRYPDYLAKCRVYTSNTLKCYLDLRLKKIKKNSKIQLPKPGNYNISTAEGNYINLTILHLSGDNNTNFDDKGIMADETCGNNMFIGAIQDIGYGYGTAIAIIVSIIAIFSIAFLGIGFCVIFEITHRNRKGKYFAHTEEKKDEKTSNVSTSVSPIGGANPPNIVPK